MYSPYQSYGYNQQQQFTPGRSNMEWIMVPTVSDVEKVSVQPGGKAWVMVQNEAVFALRSADQMGLINTDLYRFEKYEKPVEAPAPEYVTREELERAMQALTEKIGVKRHESTAK